MADTPQSTQAALEAELQRHEQRMATLQQEVTALEAVLADQQQSFHELVDRVAQLRVARAEYMAAVAQGTFKKLRFNTGCDAADQMLSLLQDKLAAARATGGADRLLTKLVDSARASAALIMAGQAPGGQVPSAPVRVTNLALITRPDVRGVRTWARKHMSSNPAFADNVHRCTPPWEPYRYDHSARGLALVPALHAIPSKTFHRLNVCLLPERSLLERADERTLDIFRFTTILKTHEKTSGRPLSDSTSAAAAIQTLSERWVRRFVELVQEKVRTAAPWNQPQTGNDPLAGAVDMLIYSIVPRVAVKALQSPPGHEAHTLLQLDVSFSTPLHVSAVDPLLELLWKPMERQYLAQTVLLPMVKALGEAFGQSVDIAHYAEVGLAVVSSLFAMAQAHNLISADDTHSGAAPTGAADAGAHGIRDRLYRILHTLALVQSAVDVDIAVPADLVESSQYAATGISLHRQASRWLQALLRNFTSPTPYKVPPLNDPSTLDVAIKLLRVPTEFLEILNRTFSSNERLPSSSRNSILDVVVTPQSKISLGLKLYSELVVELYRPFSRATGLVIASENGAQGKPKAPAGIPVIDLAADTVAANEAVAAHAATWMKKLQDAEATAPPAVPTGVSSGFSRLMEGCGQNELLAQLRDEVSALSPAVAIDGHYASYLDVLLPFGLSQATAADNRKPLLYVHISAL